MKTTAILCLVLAVMVLVSLAVWRQLDHRSDRLERARLLATQPGDPPLFTHSMVADMPAPARRYFQFSITEGTPLFTVAEITMQGRFGMGDQSDPRYVPMTAQQVLAAPEGFIWKMSGCSGAMRISGSDSAHWTRFWLANTVPVARAGGTPDHALSALGRYISEALFWTPAAVLMSSDVVWEAVDDTTARVTFEKNGERQSVDLTVDAEGRPVQVVLWRWSNANESGTYRFQPFGGRLSEFREFAGFRLPTHVEAGNLFGTESYFPFFIADVTEVRFPH